MRKIIIIAAIALALTSCVNGFQQFYRPYINTQTTPDLVLLPDGATPHIQQSNDLNHDVFLARSKGYIVVGEASFNSELQSEDNLISQAKAVRATLVIYSLNYTDTQTVITPMFVPNSTTTTTYGQLYGRNGGQSYDETSTTYGTTAVPIATEEHHYDQHAVFLVMSAKRDRVGLQFDNLTPDLRTRYERNTGVVVSVIIDGSPAFVANILPGDVVIAVNEIPVIDSLQFSNVLADAASKGTIRLKIIRNGTDKLVTVNLPTP